MYHEPCSHVLEASVQKLADFLSVSVHKFSAHTLYDTNKLAHSSGAALKSIDCGALLLLHRILEMIGHRLITSFREFGQLLPALGPPDQPVDTPDISEMKVYVCDDELGSKDYR